MKKTRSDLFLHDMIHNNPGLAIYDSEYRSAHFLKERRYDAKVFDLYDCAQYGLLWDRLSEHTHKPPVFPEGSASRSWVLEKKAQLLRDYRDAKASGLRVCFMMDVIVLPEAVKQQYPEIVNRDGKIDICAPAMEQILDCMFEEMFYEFPQIDGIYIRYGETYVGPEYNTPWHTGNNPIQGEEVQYHRYLMEYLIKTVCTRYQKDVYYRTWGFGDFQHNPETYLRISSQIPVHEHFYFCIKHTTGDFHRTFIFNQCLNIGRHKQIVEVQAAREYEGKGAYPNYIAAGVIHGFEEYKWQMDQSQTQCLADVVNAESSLIAGIWTWSRGGGWDGPYINGRNGKDGAVTVPEGKELWADINAYVVGQWAKDTSHSDRYYAEQYARNILKMSEKDVAIFYEICQLSARAVLFGRGRNSPSYELDVFFTRDQNIDYPKILHSLKHAQQLATDDVLLYEKRRSVELWSEMVELAQLLDDRCEIKNYIVMTCQYGYYLYALYEQIFLGNILALRGGRQAEVTQCVEAYERLWSQWRQLYEKTPGCPTLFVKENVIQDLIGYTGNRGLDSAIDPLRKLDDNGKLSLEF